MVGCSNTDKTAQQDEPQDTGATTTWYADIEPLITKNCAQCHGPSGVGGIALTDYSTAASEADKISIYVSSGEMPLPAADPACREYHGSEQMVLTDEEKALFTAWADDGAPIGDPEDAPAPIDWTQQLSDADTTLLLPEVHTVTPDEEGNEVYCYIIENPHDETIHLTGVDVALDNSAVVHHMLLVIDQGGDAGSAQGASAESPGFPCEDPIVEADWQLLHAWTPGQIPVEFPEGHGIRVQPDDQIVVQIHYFTNSETEETDRSGYRLRTTTSTATRVLMSPVGHADFVIPPDDPAYTSGENLPNNTGTSIQILGVFPHMHWLGSGYQARILDADGSDKECLIRADDYSFDHQGTYMFREPVTWLPGEIMYTECTWDNSASNPDQHSDPTKTVRYGQGTEDEMCFFFTYFTY